LFLQTYSDRRTSQQAGIAPDGSDTFTPRALIYDRKSAFGTLRQINALYEIQQGQTSQLPSSLWSGNTVIQQHQPLAQHDYQRHLDAGVDPPPFSKETVRYWSDFNRVFFHPRSLVQIQDADLLAGSRGAEKYEVGGEIFEELDREHDILDRDLRPFVEECDQMQGLQIVADVDDAWGGFAGSYVEKIGDEYGKIPVWAWALEDGRSRTVVCINFYFLA